MSVADKVSYFSRFTTKFVEILAASIATAVGGYLVAHLGGYLPWPSREPAPIPAAIQAAPNVSVVPKGPRAQPALPIAAGADEHRPASHHDAGPPPLQPAPATAKATPAVASHKPMATDTSTAGSRPDDMKSVETEVRAALEKVDANRPVPPEAPSQKTDIPPQPPAAAALPQPVEAPPVGAVAVAPPAADVAPPPMQPAPLQPEPLPTVEIKSRPVADVVTLPPPDTPAPAQENAKTEGKGFLSTLAKIPEMLRPAAGATSKDPPRPPLPVGD